MDRSLEAENGGQAQLCVGGEWRIFCNIGLNTAGATVFCRQIGFDAIGIIITVRMSYNM